MQCTRRDYAYELNTYITKAIQSWIIRADGGRCSILLFIVRIFVHDCHWSGSCLVYLIDPFFQMK